MSLPILRTTELACVALAYSASLSANLGLTIDNGIYAGISNTDKQAPAVICYTESATEDFPFSGIHHCRTHVMVKQIAYDTSTSSSLSDAVFGTFCSGSNGAYAKDILNRYPGFFCYEYFIDGTSDSVDGDAWVEEYVFDIVSALK
jgi:hypothetical protein